MAIDTASAGGFTGQRRIILAVFVALCLALGAGYYLFLRTDYAVLYTGLKPTDASAIVAELKAKGIAHQLRDDGTTILVPTHQADDVRLSVLGSDIPMKGAVGFELFNKSDMGLTDFAQKINYQRALQGELARTIMMMDGVESARVHLAIPERALFRANRSTPKAAIEVQAKLGRPLTTARIAGIQQLVASAVPDLPLGEVVVIDGDGRIVSQAAAMQTPEMDEQAAAQSYYGARGKAAIVGALPGLEVEVRTLALGNGDGAVTPATAATGVRDFRLRVTVLTPVPMNAEDQGIARTAVTRAIGLDETHGDSLTFDVGSIGPPASMNAVPVVAPSAGTGATDSLPAVTPADLGGRVDWWTVALGALAAALVVALALRDRAPLSIEDRDAFVGRLRAQLGQVRDDGN